MIGYGVKPHPSAHGQFVSSYGANLARMALLLDGNGFRVFSRPLSGGPDSIPVGNAASMIERFKIGNDGTLTVNGYPTSGRLFQNGYFKFHNVIIQWGRVHFSNAGWFWVTFPTAFHSSTSWGLANVSSNDEHTGCSGWTSTGCYMRGYGNYVNWVAIGY